MGCLENSPVGMASLVEAFFASTTGSHLAFASLSPFLSRRAGGMYRNGVKRRWGALSFLTVNSQRIYRRRRK